MPLYRRPLFRFPEQRAELDQQLVRELRMLHEQRLEFPRRQREGAELRVGSHRRTPWATVDDAAVAKGFARVERLQLSPAHGDVSRALEDEVESNAVATLDHDDLAWLVLDLLGEIDDRDDVLRRELIEQAVASEHRDERVLVSHVSSPSYAVDGPILRRTHPRCLSDD